MVFENCVFEFWDCIGFIMKVKISYDDKIDAANAANE